MQEIKESLDEFIRVLQKSDAFCRYQDAHRRVQEYPEKFHRLQEFRKKNYLMQNSGGTADLLAESERLMKEYEDLYVDPVVREFMDAEVAVCRIIQVVNYELVTCLEFEDVLVND
ncbi:MAG: YlbF family regulator [Clostridiales bacterium]|nr:YlbF family regulator [Clostridiales bacterium]